MVHNKAYVISYANSSDGSISTETLLSNFESLCIKRDAMSFIY